MTDSAYRIAPCGFTDDEWETFNREGILFFEDALLDGLTAAIDRVCQSSPKSGETFGCENIVERDPAFAALIDHPATLATPTTSLANCSSCTRASFLFVRPAATATISGIPTVPALCRTAPSRPICRCKLRSACG